MRFLTFSLKKCDEVRDVENRPECDALGRCANYIHSLGILPQISFKGQVLQSFCSIQKRKMVKIALKISNFTDFFLLYFIFYLYYTKNFFKSQKNCGFYRSFSIYSVNFAISVCFSSISRGMGRNLFALSSHIYGVSKRISLLRSK